MIALDYGAALVIEKSKAQHRKKLVLLIAVINTCAVLFIFKYHNFFIENFNSLGIFSFSFWNFALPIGLSFHTFQSLSYIIDVYRNKIQAEKNILIYANYVMMFPQLVAGPIERGAHLLPQLAMPFNRKLTESDFVIGMTGFFYGLFKKIVVADSIGLYVDAVYNNYTHHTGATLLLATLLFSIQIYADFSGYSDMAIGIARMLGFRFNQNFETPYFSTSIAEFWRRWHISLSSWLRDYLYYPLALGWGKVSKYKLYASTIITFTIIGLWHGANWTFIIFGMIHGWYLVLEMVTKNLRAYITEKLYLTKVPYVHKTLQALIVFVLVSLSFIFFRSPTLTQCITILHKIFDSFSFKDVQLLDTTTFATIVFSTSILYLCEYFFLRNHSFESMYETQGGRILSYTFIICSILLTLSFGQIGSATFIYFQF